MVHNDCIHNTFALFIFNLSSESSAFCRATQKALWYVGTTSQKTLFLLFSLFWGGQGTFSIEWLSQCLICRWQKPGCRFWIWKAPPLVLRATVKLVTSPVSPCRAHLSASSKCVPLLLLVVSHPILYSGHQKPGKQPCVMPHPGTPWYTFTDHLSGH